MTKQHLDRYNEQFEPSDMGRFFIGPNDQFDLSGVRILYSSVDTLRPLYKLHLDPELIEQLQAKMEEEGYGTKVFEFNGHKYHLRHGGKSGYKYLLQNKELGLIILIKSNYAKAECEGTHLKIEVSPKLISEHSRETMQYMLDEIAYLVSFDGGFSHKGTAIHLALDFQGWEPPLGFQQNLTCRSRRIRDNDGISELFVLDNDICSIHGKGQSYTFGSPTTIQMSLYNKSLEAKASDKLDYMVDCWSAKSEDFDTPMYDPELPVWRLEIRFSHHVINQFADMNTRPPEHKRDEGGNITEYDESNHVRLTTYDVLYDHLGGLWAYGMNNFRYDLNSRYVHPVWTIFGTESGFDQIQDDFIYKRKYKTAGVGNEKNIAIALGNMLSIFARNKLSAGKAHAFLKKSGIYKDVLQYFKARGMDRADVFLFIQDGLIRRRLTGNVAA